MLKCSVTAMDIRCYVKGQVRVSKMNYIFSFHIKMFTFGNFLPLIVLLLFHDCLFFYTLLFSLVQIRSVLVLISRKLTNKMNPTFVYAGSNVYKLLLFM